MDDDLFASAPHPSTPGGAVEPARRAPAASPPPHGTGEHFELRDRVADVIYRADTFPEMAVKADELGSTLFVAVAEDGKRTSIQKVDGQWQRGPQRPASTATTTARVEQVARVGPGGPVEPVGPEQARSEAPEAARVQPTAPAPNLAAATEPVEAKAQPRLEAKAERAQFVARLEAALAERYVIRPAPVSIGDLSVGRTEYRFRGDSSRVAFTESNLSLATDNNSPSVARSMVDVAQARGWRALRVSGHEDFKRLIWLEASVRGIKSLGYEPSPQDQVLLQRELEARLVNRIEPAAAAAATSGKATARAMEKATEKASVRGGGGRNTVLAAVEALLIAQKIPESQRVAVMAAAAERLAQLSSQGRVPRVKIYDKTATSRAFAMPAPGMQRGPERAPPAPQR